MSEGVGVVLQDGHDCFGAFVALSAFFFQSQVVELLLIAGQVYERFALDRKCIGRTKHQIFDF